MPNVLLMYKDELSIFIPNSFLSESKDLKIRTYKVGILGRALAIFQADNVVIYNDNHAKNEDGELDGDFIAEVELSENTAMRYINKALKDCGIEPIPYKSNSCLMERS